MGGHEHLYLYRRKNNRILLKSGVDFFSFSDMRFDFSQSFYSPEMNAQLSETRRIAISTNPPANDYFSKNEKSVVIEANGDFSMNKVGAQGLTFRDYDSDFYYNNNQMDIVLNHFKDCSELRNETLGGPIGDQNNKIEITTQCVWVDLKETSEDMQKDGIYKELKEYSDSIYITLEERGKQPLFILKPSIDMTSRHIRTNENVFGNFIAKLVQIELGAELLFLNSGCLRSFTHYPEDHVFTWMDLNKITPCPNYYQLARMKGYQIIQMLENSYRGLPDPLGSFNQIAGARVWITPSKLYDEEAVLKRKSDVFKGRISKIQFEGRRFDKDHVYLVSMRHFPMSGKDGFSAMKECCVFADFGEEVNNYNCLLHFGSLPSNAEIREEYALFEKHLKPFVVDQDLYNIQRKNNDWVFSDYRGEIVHIRHNAKLDTAKDEFLTLKSLERNKLVNSISEERLRALLEGLKVETIKRLRKYLLVEGISKIEENYVFEIHPRLENRVNILK